MLSYLAWQLLIVLTHFLRHFVPMKVINKQPLCLSIYLHEMVCNDRQKDRLLPQSTSELTVVL